MLNWFGCYRWNPKEGCVWSPWTKATFNVPWGKQRPQGNHAQYISPVTLVRYGLCHTDTYHSQHGCLLLAALAAPSHFCIAYHMFLLWLAYQTSQRVGCLSSCHRMTCMALAVHGIFNSMKGTGGPAASSAPPLNLSDSFGFCLYKQINWVLTVAPESLELTVIHNPNTRVHLQTGYLHARGPSLKCQSLDSSPLSTVPLPAFRKSTLGPRRDNLLKIVLTGL